MQMRYVIVFLSFSILLGCQPTANPQPKEQEPDFVNEVGVLQLNNGQKWKVNPETKKDILEFKAMIKRYSEEHDPENIHFYGNVAYSSFRAIKTIFKDCTMTGPGHDELHDFLYPIMRYRNKLESEDPEEAEKAFQKIQEQLELFDTYFE
jgi:superfamily I DNA/RNA helicase